MKSLSQNTFCLFIILSITACNQNRHADIDTSLINTTTPQHISPSDSSALVTPLNASPAAINNGTLLALNPPHGQPGHDCAIPVGQPLNGKQNSNAQPTAVSATPQIVNPAPQITPINTNGSVAINPPHGQPGHDCAVAVGSPLNSKSNPSAAPTVSPVVNTPTQILPVTNANSNVALNPPHGQPGHDCAIPVGQPLKK